MTTNRGWTKEEPLHSGESTLCREKDANVDYEYNAVDSMIILAGDRQVEVAFEGDLAEALVDKTVRARLTCNGEGHTNWYWVVLSSA